MPNRVITISREFGSGGRTIGKMVAEKLGIPCYDAELIEKIAEQSGYSAEYIKQEVEYGTGGWLSAVFADRSAGLTNQDKMFSIQSRIIEELANEGPCVIVGRCADFVLKDKADCLNVFIHASMERGQSASSRSTASGRRVRKSGLKRRISGERLTIGSTQT